MPARNVNLAAEQEAFVKEIIRAQIKAGLEALECGAFTEVEEADLDAAIDRFAATATR